MDRLMAAVDTLVNPQAQRLLQCLEDSLFDHPYPPLTISIRAGERAVMGITMDSKDECACGYAWVRWMDTFPTDETSFPGVSASTQPGCGISWAARFEVGIARCSPDPVSTPITPDAWQLLHLKLMLDAASIRQTFCCFDSVSPPWRYNLGTIAPFGPDGLCIGTRAEITVLLEACDGC